MADEITYVLLRGKAGSGISFAEANDAGATVFEADLDPNAAHYTLSRVVIFSGTVEVGDVRRIAVPEAVGRVVAITGITIIGISNYWGSGTGTTINVLNHAPDTTPTGAVNETVAIAAAEAFTARAALTNKLMLADYPYIYLSVATAGGHADVQVQIDLEVQDAR